MVRSERLELPFLAAGQAQKELVHNEALLLLDCIVHACCSGEPADQPPQEPELGLTYICGEEPVGDWTGRPGQLACWTEAGWRFIKPFDGLNVSDRSSGTSWHFRVGQWHHGIVKANQVQVEGLKVVGNRQPGIANATGGTSVDAEARHVLGQMLNALRAHGLIASS